MHSEMSEISEIFPEILEARGSIDREVEQDKL